MKRLLCIAVGSALGGGARYFLDVLALEFSGVGFPVSTMLTNVSGSLLIGWFAGRWAIVGAQRASAQRWDFWVTGFCGGYTTFSTFSWQILEMIQSGHGQVAGFYAAASVGLGVVAVWVGMSLAVAKRGQQRVKDGGHEQN